MMGWDISLALRLKAPILPYDRQHAINPLITSYKAGDGRWFWLLLLQADRHGPTLSAIEREDLLSDERLRTSRSAGSTARRGGADFRCEEPGGMGETFDRNTVWWAPVNSINQVVNDPVAQAAGAFAEAPGPDGPTPVVATPADFSETLQAPRGPAPEVGQHTEEVLLELGYGWEEIVTLKGSGVIP
jgi:crotonobetainyl-CoA:carnitine CoA-transferase CaiB-like acyl-CoA transferase